MTKKDYIRAADLIRALPGASYGDQCTTETIISFLVRLFEGENPRFNRQRFLDYCHGLCGPNGGKVTP